MNIIEETNKVLAQRLLSYFDSKKLIDWAILLMQNDYESESLIILAGLDSDTTEEREKYFWKSIEELDINVNVSDFELIDNYALYIAKSVVDNQLTPYEGLNIMQDIVRESDYSNKYISFYELDEDIDYLKYDNHTIFNSGLSLKNAESFIKKEFELFVKIEELKLDNEIYEKSYCRNCKTISKPKFKRRFQLKLLQYIQIPVCGNCGSRKIESFRSQTGKEIIINEIKKRTHNTGS